MERTVVDMVATDDPPEVKANNPIHGSGAQAAGYDKPIVGGVSSYAWATAAVVELLGDGWLDYGWADYALRRPVYAGDQLRSTATIIGEGVCEYTQHNADGKVTVEGRAGVGLAGWHGEWQLPAVETPSRPRSPHRWCCPKSPPSMRTSRRGQTTLAEARYGGAAVAVIENADHVGSSVAIDAVLDAVLPFLASQ